MLPTAEPQALARVHDSRSVVLVAVAILLVAVVVWPVVQLVYRSVVTDAGIGLAHYRRALTQPGQVRALLNTVSVGVGAAAAAVAVGASLAFLLVRTDVPGRTWLRTLLVLPYAIPPFFGAMAWAQLLGPEGYLTRPILALLGLAEAPWSIYSAGGIIFVMAIHFFPFVFLTTAGALERMDASLEEAARASGAGTLQIMRDITLPLVLPAVAAGGVLAFIGAIANFGIPALLGLRARYYVLTTSVYAALHLPDFALATATSMLLVGVATVALLAQWRLQRGEQRFAVIAGKSVRPQTLRLGRLRAPATGLTVALAVVIAVLPLTALLVTALLRYYGAPLTASSFSLRHFAYVVTQESIRRAAWNSTVLAMGTATIALLAATVVSYARRAGLRGAAALDTLGMLPYALPHTVIGIAMILAWTRPPVMLYGTLTILLVAYLVAYLPYALRTTAATLAQVHGSLEEAARVAGAGPFQAVRDIVAPLIRPGLVAGWILIFLPAFRELTMSILLFGLRTETIGVVIFNLQDSGYTQIAAALSVLVLAAILAGGLAVRAATRGQLGF
ncbi:MAG: iron ABC transporter permease [Armatimonadota bacterium]|nr:iron ABC transporter permease [Armatimonadota bacterium]MDR7485259.1 iron ABC transporter permease [Armatimonadota bacterium]MDR7533903.1 iron ABC transporter permease [Armatimonadota bacterium]MDR7537135.1 iron ABC transporter permease [Armatimonadota bacterium]